MILKCKATCTKVHKRSQSPAFKDLKYGDMIEFSIEIKRTGRFVAYIRCFNPQTKAESKLSFNQIVKTLECFEFEEVEDIKCISCGMGYSLQENGMPPLRCHMDEAPRFCKDCCEYVVE